MRALHDLVSSGKVRYLAASSMWAFELATLQFVAEKNRWTPFVAMQNHYNLLYREEEREVIKFCNRTGVGLLPVSSGNKVKHISPNARTDVDTVVTACGRPSGTAARATGLQPAIVERIPFRQWTE